jgi:hypothetical protein
VGLDDARPRSALRNHAEWGFDTRLGASNVVAAHGAAARGNARTALVPEHEARILLDVRKRRTKRDGALRAVARALYIEHRDAVAIHGAASNDDRAEAARRHTAGRSAAR